MALWRTKTKSREQFRTGDFRLLPHEQAKSARDGTILQRIRHHAIYGQYNPLGGKITIRDIHFARASGLVRRKILSDNL